jgi:hypothetical protein
MTNRLAITALMALLVFMPDARPVRAQFSHPQVSEEGSVAAAPAQYRRDRDGRALQEIIRRHI